jgi:hypothetical protein
MALLVPNVGEIELLDKLLKDALVDDEDYILKLYQNNYDPIATSTAANFTVCTFDNYSDKTLTRAGWGAAAEVGGVATSSYSVEQSWTCNSGTQDVYGYYIVGGDAPNTLLWAEKFTVTRTLAAGDSLRMTPKFTLRSQP